MIKLFGNKLTVFSFLAATVVMTGAYVAEQTIPYGRELHMQRMAKIYHAECGGETEACAKKSATALAREMAALDAAEQEASKSLTGRLRANAQAVVDLQSSLAE